MKIQGLDIMDPFAVTKAIEKLEDEIEEKDEELRYAARENRDLEDSLFQAQEAMPDPSTMRLIKVLEDVDAGAMTKVLSAALRISQYQYGYSSAESEAIERMMATI